MIKEIILLKYLKVNKTVIDFQEGLNIISCIPRDEKDNNNNIGKTTLIHILQAIYGQRKLNPINDGLAKKIKKNKLECEVKWCFIIENNQYEFSYNLNNGKVIQYNDGQISINEYKNFITDLLNNKIRVFKELINFDYRFIRKTSNVFLIEKMFNHRSKSYKAFFLFKLLFDEKNEIDEMQRAEKYFSKVAKRNSYKNIRGKYHNELIEAIMDTDEDDAFIKIDKLSKELKKYKKIKKNKKDDLIIDEIKKINLNIDIDKIIHFHDMLINDYNEMITEKINDIELDIKNIKINIPIFDINDYSQSDIDIAVEVSSFLFKVDDELRDDYLKLKSSIDGVIELANNKIRQYNNNISEVLSINNPTPLLAMNQFSLGYESESILHSLKFVQKLNQSSGDANIAMNTLLLYAHILKNSRVNIVALDTIHTSELTPTNLNLTLSNISKIIDKNQYIVMLFDGSVDERIFKNEIIHYIGSNKKSLLGYKI